MIISLSGAPGSGKSTIAQRLADEYNWPRYYIGGLRREKAKMRGLTLTEYNQLGEIDPVTDQEVDSYQTELGRNQDNFIIEGRTSWYFIPHSLKIYINVSLEEGSRRIFNSLQKKNERNEGVLLENIEAVKRGMLERAESDRKRYQKYYDIDVNNPKHYDLYLDATSLSQEEEYLAVYDFVKTRLDNGKK
jgi:cytidylate kinase